MGRRKIKMEIAKDAASRLVTFSKRRNGLFKKANELAILCGAELAIVVFSPGSKPFSFGHPSVDAVTQRFLRHLQDKDDGNEDEEAKSPVGGTSSSSGSKKARRKAEKLNKRLMNLTEELEEEKKKGSILDKVIEEKKQEYGLGLGPGPEIEAIAGESEGRGEAEEERNGGSSVFTGTCRETGSEKLNLAVFIEKSSLEGSRKWRFQRPILEARCTKGKFFS